MSQTKNQAVNQHGLNTENGIIQLALNSKVRDIPNGMYLRFEYGDYIVKIDFDEKSEISVYDDDWNHEVTIEDPDPEVKIIDFAEDAKRLIEKYQQKRAKEGGR